MANQLFEMLSPEASRKALQDMESMRTEVVVQFWTAIGKPVDRKQLALYMSQLDGVPLGVLEDAVSQLLKGSDWHTIPTIGEVWNSIRELIGTGKSWKTGQYVRELQDQQDDRMERYLLAKYYQRAKEREDKHTGNYDDGGASCDAWKKWGAEHAKQLR